MNPKRITWCQVDGLFNQLILAASDKGLCCLTFGKRSAIAILKNWTDRLGLSMQLEQNERLLIPYISQIEAYFIKNRKEFDFPLDLYGTPFQKKVWEQ